MRPPNKSQTRMSVLPLRSTDEFRKPKNQCTGYKQHPVGRELYRVVPTRVSHMEVTPKLKQL